MARKYKLLNWSRKCEYHGTSYGSYVKIIYIVLILYINLNFPMSLIRWNTRLFYSHWCGQINCKVIKCTLQLYSKGITLQVSCNQKWKKQKKNKHTTMLSNFQAVVSQMTIPTISTTISTRTINFVFFFFFNKKRVGKYIGEENRAETTF